MSYNQYNFCNDFEVITARMAKVGMLSVTKLTLVLHAGFKNLMFDKHHWLSQKNFPLLEHYFRLRHYEC